MQGIDESKDTDNFGENVKIKNDSELKYTVTLFRKLNRFANVTWVRVKPYTWTGRV